MTNYAQIWLILANCGRIYGQKWPDLWPNEIVGMAMAIVAIPDITSMVMDNLKVIVHHNYGHLCDGQSYLNRGVYFVPKF